MGTAILITLIVLFVVFGLLVYMIAQVTKMEYTVMRAYDEELYGPETAPKDQSNIAHYREKQAHSTSEKYNNIGHIIDVTIEEYPNVNTVKNSSKTD